MMTDSPTTLSNARSLAVDAVPLAPWDVFEEALLGGVAAGARVSSFFGLWPEGGEGVELLAVLADDQSSRLTLLRTLVQAAEFPSLTPRLAQVHLFEREIEEQFEIEARGHPWSKPVRFAPPLPRPGAPPNTEARASIGDIVYYRVEGDSVHEVAVGPVHAGVIEPGHFRFQCHGEEVFHLEISLGYQHRGVERALVGGPDARTLHYVETAAGDTTVGHTLAHCLVVEALADTRKSARAQSLRGIALELERLANHVGDLGALAADVGFQPTASFCGRLRGEYLNMTAALCGSRFGRGLVRPGGVRFDLRDDQVSDLLARLETAERETRDAVQLLWKAPSVMARFEETGHVPREVARELGMVGPAARASGLQRDVRRDQPFGLFRFSQIPISNWDTGDVQARALVRWHEIRRSTAFVRAELGQLPAGAIQHAHGPLAPRRIAVALVEGWRGEICHVALTDEAGRIRRYKIVDPSFHNWSGLAHALRGQQISDFPICNKSFGLSYCGHDL